MIARYTREEMAKIWSDENKYNLWLKVEILACEAQAKLGLIPKDALEIIKAKAKIDVKRILEIEETTKHDVIAFLTNVEESVGEPSRYIHLGMTSSDVLDTAFAVQCKQAGELIIKDLEKLREVLLRRAKEFKRVVCVGRTHGIHAEPTTFGLKFALWLDETERNLERMKTAVERISVGKINGAVGSFEHLDPFVESYVCEKLGLKPARITTQVISRDLHAEFISTIALIASMLEKIAVELRHLQRTEVREAEEYFSKGQKGSSAMPHKRNPISAENISGQARILRANVIAALENNALWHERDISHSSVERIIFPDSTISLDYILNRTIKLLDNLLVYPEKMKENLEITNGLIFSQKILLALAKKGLKRQKAYEIVQKSAMRTWEENVSFKKSLLENEEAVKYLTPEEIESLFGYEEIFKGEDYIYKRLGIE